VACLSHLLTRFHYLLYLEFRNVSLNFLSHLNYSLSSPHILWMGWMFHYLSLINYMHAWFTIFSNWIMGLFAGLMHCMLCCMQMEGTLPRFSAYCTIYKLRQMLKDQESNYTFTYVFKSVMVCSMLWFCCFIRNSALKFCRQNIRISIFEMYFYFRWW
jgi:hypothetical protein